MKAKLSIAGGEYSIDTSNPLDISIPLMFNGAQPNTYNVEAAAAEAYKAGENFIGDTRQGGSCNFEKYTLVPHCNGTHTEGVGHISLERISINKILKDCFIPSILITIEPENASASGESYTPAFESPDMVITKKAVKRALTNCNPDFLKGLVIRTLPNDKSKKSRNYMESHPPFFSIDAMEYIDSLGIEHLLTDLPSVDRTFDEGKLTAHHIYWNVKRESKEVDAGNHSLRTITEMIYVQDDISDGEYIIHIQIPNFIADAAPSRVFLYNIIN